MHRLVCAALIAACSHPRAAPPPQPLALPARGEACPGGACAEGFTCMHYFGVAGPRGPELTSCERLCGSGCPAGERCVTIADGPGRVCQPRPHQGEP